MILGRGAERVEPCEWAGGAEEFEEWAVFVAGGFGAIGGVDERGHVAVTVVAVEVGAGQRTVVDDEGLESAHTARALHRSAEVAAPDEAQARAGDFIDLTHEVPAVVEEAQAGGELIAARSGIPREDLFADTAALVIVGRVEALPVVGIRDGVGARFDAREPVLAVPGVGPQTVLREVAVGVVDECFRRLWHEAQARDDAGAGGVGGAAREPLHQSRRDVVHADFLPVILALPRGTRAIHRHGRGGVRRAVDFQITGHGAVGVLVEQVHAVGLRALRAGCAAARALAVADVVEGVVEGRNHFSENSIQNRFLPSSISRTTHRSLATASRRIPTTNDITAPTNRLVLYKTRLGITSKQGELL